MFSSFYFLGGFMKRQNKQLKSLFINKLYKQRAFYFYTHTWYAENYCLDGKRDGNARCWCLEFGHKFGKEETKWWCTSNYQKYDDKVCWKKMTFFNPKNTWNLMVKKENVFINYRIYLTYKDDPSPSSIDRYHIFSFCCHHFVSL